MKKRENLKNIRNIFLTILTNEVCCPTNYIQRNYFYQFDSHIFIGVQVLSKSQLSKVPTADLLSDPEVWSNH